MSASEDIVACGFEVHPHEHAVLVDGRAVDLTSREFDIVLRLAEHPGWVFTPEQLACDDSDGEFSPESVSVHVSHLRQKLTSAGIEDVVHTVRGVGYRLQAPSAQGDGAREPDGLDATTPAMRDAIWRLGEAAVQVEHTGTAEQQAAAAAAIDAARREIYALLAR